MRKYKIWDKKEPVLTPDFKVWTAEEFIEKFCPAAKLDNFKVVISAGDINGATLDAFTTLVQIGKDLGVEYTEDMDDQEFLDLFAAKQSEPPEQIPSAEERIAAALELQNLLAL